jgi:hypothetical protein
VLVACCGRLGVKVVRFHPKYMGAYVCISKGILSQNVLRASLLVHVASPSSCWVRGPSYWVRGPSYGVRAPSYCHGTQQEAFLAAAAARGSGVRSDLNSLRGATAESINGCKYVISNTTSAGCASAKSYISIGSVAKLNSIAPVLFWGILPLYPHVSVLLSGMGLTGPGAGVGGAGGAGGAGGGSGPMEPDAHDCAGWQMPLFATSSLDLRKHPSPARHVHPAHPESAIHKLQQALSLASGVWRMSLAWNVTPTD